MPGGWSIAGNCKQIGFGRYYSFESKYLGDRSFSLLLATVSPPCFYFFISDFSLPSPVRARLPTPVHEPSSECVPVRITNRKRFSYSPFIKNSRCVLRTETHSRFNLRLARCLCLHFVSFSPVRSPRFPPFQAAFTCQQQPRLDYMREIN